MTKLTLALGRDMMVSFSSDLVCMLQKEKKGGRVGFAFDLPYDLAKPLGPKPPIN
jgi:hypothetical protein